MGFELGTSGIQAQSSTTELHGNLGKIAEILGENHKVSFGPPDFQYGSLTSSTTVPCYVPF